MQRWMCVVFLLLCSAALTGQDVPKPNGVYVLNGSTWTKMFQASASGLKTSGAAKTMFSYGAASMKSVMVYREPSAPVSVSVKRPEFLLVGPFDTAPRDIVIVRLDRKKDHRELQIGKFNAYRGSQMQYRPGDVTSVEVKAGGVALLLAPKADLKPGEYVIFTSSPNPMAMGYGGYDFTVAAN